MMKLKSLKENEVKEYVNKFGEEKFVYQIKEDGCYCLLDLNTQEYVVEGELVVLDSKGRSLFNDGIAHRTHLSVDNVSVGICKEYPVTLIVWDILKYKGNSIIDKPYSERMELLDKLLELKPKGEVRLINRRKVNITEKYPELVGDLWGNIQKVAQFETFKEVWKQITDLKLEGCVIKKKSGNYEWEKRSWNSIKVKAWKEAILDINKYEVNPKGITLENDDGHKVVCLGSQAEAVKEAIDLNGNVKVEIQYLEFTKNGRYRKPSFKRMVGEA